jgi:hypothetical protein
LSFINLVEAHVLHSIRHIHQVKLRKVRSALDYVERESGGRHPLATQQFQTDGVDLFIEKLGSLIIASAGGQVALREAFEAHLKRVEHVFGIARDCSCSRGQPSTSRRSSSSILAFGRPIIVGRHSTAPSSSATTP